MSVFPDETVGVAMQRMAPRDISRLPVVSRQDPKKLVGVVRRNDIVRAYDLGSIRREEARLHAAHIGSINHTKAQFTEIRVTGRSLASGRVISDLSLPHEAVIVSVQRGHELLIPHGDTRLAVGDMVTILCEQDVVGEVRSTFKDEENSQV